MTGIDRDIVRLVGLNEAFIQRNAMGNTRGKPVSAGCALMTCALSAKCVGQAIRDWFTESARRMYMFLAVLAAHTHTHTGG